MEKKSSYLMGNRGNSKAVLERKINNKIREHEEKISIKIQKHEESILALSTTCQEMKKDVKKLIGIVEEQGKQLEILWQDKKELLENMNGMKREFDRETLETKNEQAGIVREFMKIKWKELDREAAENEHPDDLIECLICGNRERRGRLEIKVAECIYNGGKLERYVCACCGGIFGPTKFLNLSQKDKDEDYYVHYLGFVENDATEKELRAFYMLNPKKEGIYLNYGCGNWSRSLQILQQEGYTVYGYEPYAKDGNGNPNLITEKSVLEKMRFDGIFSNDVIEHFANPIEEFQNMKKLLRDSNAKMSHSTSCYEYKHEETRFHTFFFTGDSLDYLCKKTGIVSSEYVNDLEQNDFICHVFTTDSFEEDYLPMMYTMGNAEKREDGIVLQEGAILYGPYLNFSKGNLKWIIEIDSESQEELKIRITSQAGVKVIKEELLSQGRNEVLCQLETEEKQVELVIQNNQDTPVKVLQIKQV